MRDKNWSWSSPRHAFQGQWGSGFTVVLRAVRASFCTEDVQIPLRRSSPALWQEVTRSTGGVCVRRSHHHHAEFRPGRAEGVHSVCHCHRPGAGAAGRRVPGHRPHRRPQRQRPQVWEQPLPVWVLLTCLPHCCHMNLIRRLFLRTAVSLLGDQSSFVAHLPVAV